MLEALTALLEVLNKFTPLGVAAILGLAIFVFIWKNGPMRKLKDNHLAHVQASLDKIVESGDKQVDLLVDIKTDISFLKGKLDN